MRSLPIWVDPRTLRESSPATMILLADSTVDKAHRPLIGDFQRVYDLDPSTDTWIEKPKGMNRRAFGDRIVAADFNMDGLMDFVEHHNSGKVKHGVAALEGFWRGVFEGTVPGEVDAIMTQAAFRKGFG